MEKTLSFNQKIITVLLITAGLATLWYLHEIILLIFLAIIIAIGISVPASKLERQGLSRELSMALSVILVSTVFIGIIFWLTPILFNEFQNLITSLPQLFSDLQNQFNGTWAAPIFDSLANSSGLASGNGGESGSTAAAYGELASRFVDNGLPFVFSGAGALASLATNLFLVLVVSIMLLIEPKSYIKALLNLVPKRAHKRIVNLSNRAYDTIKAWLVSVSISITFTAITVFIGMLIIGVPNPAAIAMFAGLATFVPNIGAIIPLIPIALFTIGSSFELFIIATITYFAIQLFESNVFTPAVVKHQLNIPVAAILVFQITAGILFGLLGVLLAVPLLAVVIMTVRELVTRGYYGYESNQIELSADKKHHLHLQSDGGEI